MSRSLWSEVAWTTAIAVWLGVVLAIEWWAAVAITAPTLAVSIASLRYAVQGELARERVDTKLREQARRG